jgi:hypothetical protein
MRIDGNLSSYCRGPVGLAVEAKTDVMRQPGFALVLLFLLAARAAWAQEYVRTRISPKSDVCLAWSQRVYDYSVDIKGLEGAPGDAEFDAIKASFAIWQKASNACSDFRFVDLGKITNFKVGQVSGSADDNVITFQTKHCNQVVSATDACWSKESCGTTYACWDGSAFTYAVTITSFNARTGVLFDADIEFNAAPSSNGGPPHFFTTVNSPPCPASSPAANCVAIDIQNTLTHEIGHVIGLDHVLDEDSTMFASAPSGETSKRILDEGTQKALCEIYPKGDPFSKPCDSLASLRRKIVAKSNGTPGFEAVGCSSAGLGPVSAGWLFLLGGGLLLQRKKCRRSTEAPRPPEETG